jgi:hypothetical protein
MMIRHKAISAGGSNLFEFVLLLSIVTSTSFQFEVVQNEGNHIDLLAFFAFFSKMG